MKKIALGIISVGVSGLIIFSCKKKYDAPPQQVIPSGNPVTIAALKMMYAGKDTVFKSDINLYCTVIADETSGNIYKESYVRDASGAIHIRLLASGGLYVGDSIRINLKGAKLTQYQGVIQLDSVDVDKMVVKQKTGLNPSPITVNITQINDNYLSQLIKLNNVEFICADKNQYFADATNQQSLNRVLTDCNGNQIIVRTSGYANFANQKTPSGNGSIVAVVGKYGGVYQLYIRNYAEVNMNGPHCSFAATNTLTESFSSQTNGSNIALSGWSNFNVFGASSSTGALLWTADNTSFSSNTVAKASLYGASTTGTQDTLWLVTPPIQATGSGTINLSFDVGLKFYDVGHPNLLSVMISTNYDPFNCSVSTWTTVPGFTIPSGNTTNLQPAGTVNIAPLLPPGYTGTFRIGFKHYGKKGTYDSNIYIDNVTVN